MYLTVSDVAAQLRISKASVYQLIEGGRIAHHRIGARRGAIRISQDDLATYMDECHHGLAEKRSPQRPANARKLKHIRL